MPLVKHRLEKSFAFLETLALIRSIEGDESFGRAAEGRIVQREVIDLEMQEVDAAIDNICQRSSERAA
ncbi:MAG: hypothetical protein IANPNBLG_04873 [Bryobacteraceae bacterium]|uniref:hypothetical protein n=1 Tax=Paracoccus sp. TaxID=267 RepID=UPI001D95AFCE|nr:hypothetical protein [Bryobacteraceae bacterium]MCC6341165.1 hypothetical protein [Bryobacterales bacterium]